MQTLNGDVGALFADCCVAQINPKFRAHDPRVDIQKLFAFHDCFNIGEYLWKAIGNVMLALSGCDPVRHTQYIRANYSPEETAKRELNKYLSAHMTRALINR